MNRIRKRKPTHPGVVFRADVLEVIGMSVSEAAKKLGISRKHLSAFLNEKVPCSPDMAKRLSIATDTSIASWLNMQTACDVWEAENNKNEKYQEVGRIAYS